MMFETHILLTGLFVFAARICDVSIGTIRTIVTVQGRTTIAFMLATSEITIWVTVAGTVINQIKDKPLLVVFMRLDTRPAMWLESWRNENWPLKPQFLESSPARQDLISLPI